MASGTAHAVSGKKPASTPPAAARQAAPPPESLRSRADVVTATSAAPGQAGYVHYFLLTHPDQTLEYQVGIELADQRIAWSFPGVGVSVSPFMNNGAIEVNGVEYGIEHLYGIRPFPDDASMRVLREQIGPRVALWIDDDVPYCVHPTRGGPFCVSCGDFVVRILFPGETRRIPDLPRDFFRAPVGSGAAPSTDDLLLYLMGLSDLPSREARLKRISGLNLPQALREDISQLVAEMDVDAAPTSAVAAAPRVSPRRLRATSRPAPKVVQQPPQRKRL
jgi:hypothetical protein